MSPEPVFDAKAYRESQKAARRREREAVAAARPSYYRRRRALGFVAIGVGGGLAATGLSMAVLHVLAEGMPHSESDSPMSTGEKRLIGCSLGIGLPVLGVGIWAVRSPVLEAQQMRLSLAPRVGGQGELGLVAKLSL